jgi:4-hydroxy-tetrahydrodipicolinate reductase
MGRAIVRLAAADPGVRLVAGLTIAGDPSVGLDLGVVAGVQPIGVTVAEEFTVAADVLIDFTSPSACIHWARWCATQRVPFVSGTTGLDATQHEALRDAAKATPVLWASNMSVGVNLLIELAGQMARTLGETWDVEIVEAHHRQKADAPSGTAKSLLSAVCEARGTSPESAVRHGRSGAPGPRTRGEIGVHAVRMGGVVGDHDVHFASPGEIITLRHHAESRDIFARGALRAARWIAERPAGLYQMRDVLGLDRSPGS